MASERKGIPYTFTECELVVATHSMDEYHRDLMKWLLEKATRRETDRILQDKE